MVNEILDYAKKKGKPCMMFKIDFEKAYDLVSWEFLDYLFIRMGFNTKWRALIRECLHSSSVSVLVNGSPTKEFRMSKGLRQGDPMAPFLFLIVAKGLSRLIQSAFERKIFMEYSFERGGEKISMSHIQYADDTILIAEMSKANIWAIKCILRSYELVSGLKVNFHKSGLICSKVSHALVEGAAHTLNCKIGNLPFKFLGIIVGANPRRSSTWTPCDQSSTKAPPRLDEQIPLFWRPCDSN